MTSFQITLSPSRRAAGRFVNSVRRKLQKAFAEESKHSGLTQTDVAKTIGVHRSVINRELRGHKDITLGRVAELASAMGRRAVIEFEEVSYAPQRNVHDGCTAIEVRSDYSLAVESEEMIDEEANFDLAAY